MSGALVYRVPAAGTFPFILGFMALVGFLALALTLTGDGPLWFVLVYLAIVGWNAWSFLFRFARAASIESGALRWTGFVSSESVRLDEITRLSVWPGSSVQVVECRDGRKLRIPITPGYRPLGDALEAAIERRAQATRDIRER